MSVVHKIVWGGNPDKPDKVSGLTRRDIYHVQKTWKLLYTDPQELGVHLFKSVIEAEPDARSYFPNWKSYPDDSLFTESQFTAHSKKVAQALDGVVNKMNDPEALKKTMHTMGKYHCARKIPKRLFHMMKTVLLDTMRDRINLQQKHAVSWEKLIDFFYSGILPMLDR